MAYTVPEQSIWVLLRAIDKTAGAQGPRILAAAGMGRFLTTAPSRTSLTPVATQEELSTLFRQIYTMLGEDLTRLFHRNYGEFTVEGILQLPWAAQLRAEGRAVPVDQQVSWFARTFGEVTSRAWAPHIFSEDARACYLAGDPCFACSGITGVKKPICAAGQVIFANVAHDFLGRRVRVAEVECAAMGHPYCKYALYK